MSGILDWFRDPGLTGLANWLVSLGALGVSIWAIRATRRMQGRLLDIEERREHQRERESTKARLRVERVREPTTRGTRDLLRIYNDGQAEARDVRVVLDGNPVLDHPAIPRGPKEARTIGPGSHVQYLLAVSFDMPAPRDVQVTWSDDSGESGSYRTTLAT